MTDENSPDPSPQSSTEFSAHPPRNTTGDITNGFVPPGPPPATNGEGAPGAPAPTAATPEWLLLLRWVLGFLLVLVCGWGLLALAFFLTRSVKSNMEAALAVTSVLDLGLFLLLERNFWLSRFMGLRIEPNSHPWHSAIFLWLLGVPGLLFRSTNFHPKPAAAAQPARARSVQHPTQHSDSIREVVETIVFVVVLVLLLKSFAAEAFVIPTGSMAQTLLGYQKEVVCPDCGIKFPINCSREVDPTEGRPMKTFACVCPNCRQRIHFRGALSPERLEAYLRDNPDSIEIDDPGWNSGDRVLVAKFVYDLLGKAPDRLDVVVFKYPGDQSFPLSGPHKGHVPMNYIKRLIGESGETIAICGGNLYVLAANKGPRYDDYEKAKNDPEMMATLWQKRYMHQNEATEQFHKGQFRIVHKSPENILAMMRLVYDNDHPSKHRDLPPRWISPDRAWKADKEHGFRLEGGDAKQEHYLHYQHILRDNLEDNRPDHHLSLITDCMGYNTYHDGMHQPLLGNNWVGDLILECEASIDTPQGELTLELSKGVDRFRARWNLADGTCTLLRVTNQGEQKLDSKPTSMSKKGDYRLRFANVDERLVVWVNGELPFDSGFDYPPPADAGPVEKNDLEKPAGVGVRGGAVAIHKLRLFRDTYYTTGGHDNERPNEADVAGFTANDPSTWRGLHTPPVLTLYVQPDHFLCLGDNSPESSDGRSWGAVPKRLLLGRALLVYYPFGRAGRIR
jgi:signal peptidase I